MHVNDITTGLSVPIALWNRSRSVMNRYRENIIVLMLCIAVGALPIDASSTTTQEDAESELSVIHKMIRVVSSRLTSARSKQDAIQEQLRKAELAIGQLTAELRKIERRLQRRQKRLSNLRRQQRKQGKALASQRKDLARQIRISYAMGRQDYLKILLNQEDPSALARALTYYGYFNRARAEQIQAVRSRIERIRALTREMDQATVALEGLKQAKIKAKNNVKKHFRQREEALAELFREIAQDDQRLVHLKEDKSRLEAIISDIKQAFTHSTDQRSFPALRGRLRWPTVGLVKHHFGTKRTPGDLTWQGAWIAAEADQPIHAISHGQVVFADWLRGFGLLMIIDHGDGYMSLYAHSKSLYKETGDIIESGDIIASVGNSGGNDEDGLYFEIRHQGSPQNPAYWCKNPPLPAGRS
uniref:Septal ring factor EnvC, activator of murein hydrolases AmiA and AmiB n=1 Tax=Candidatus Kentrum sp. FW TaxID=2126338 RepID=A0A450T9S8_9GAMM|nr:MAG: Septal ring factor EnvC, activator of murein hydrolases AmiA and AmiB [Candidatus Kentron sp. FW]